MIVVGLLNGTVYVNTFYLIQTKEIFGPPNDRELCTNIAAIFINIGESSDYTKLMVLGLNKSDLRIKRNVTSQELRTKDARSWKQQVGIASGPEQIFSGPLRRYLETYSYELQNLMTRNNMIYVYLWECRGLVPTCDGILQRNRRTLPFLDHMMQHSHLTGVGTSLRVVAH